MLQFLKKNRLGHTGQTRNIKPVNTHTYKRTPHTHTLTHTHTHTHTHKQIRHTQKAQINQELEASDNSTRIRSGQRHMSTSRMLPGKTKDTQQKQI